ncbi:substrate-binding periplasmic protein [Pseudoalteromonas piscicida]|uniref:ABC transporter substrate-binding protein n=1 Tax=Pseudoalteromonas piscicida TaxID=43662 RepID=A0A2A5JMJ3_PSEO7|nr:transporter substrate-binding domain-containing protein [Pseudoalteromonas piscicida]PCK30648.1 ABC transporter substrate-binding protein [Pseudoalteromonas piscicida]
MSRLLWLFALLCHSAFSCELIVRFENYAAQSTLDEKLVWHGMDVDFAKALLDEAGCGYRFVSIPWGRALKLLQEGEIDLILSVSKTPAREQYAYFVGPQRMETIVFAMNTEQPYQLDTLESLFNLPKPIAIHRDAFYGEAFMERLAQRTERETQFIYVPDNQVKLTLLKKGRIAGFLEEKFNVLYQSKSNPDFEKLTINPFIINEMPVYYAFSKKRTSNERLQRLNQAFERLKRSGKLSQISAKYGVN